MHRCTPEVARLLPKEGTKRASGSDNQASFRPEDLLLVHYCSHGPESPVPSVETQRTMVRTLPAV